MDLKELKYILQKDKGKIIIVEDGKPIMIVLPYESFTAKNNQEEIAEPLLDEEEVNSISGELTIDDLPL